VNDRGQAEDCNLSPQIQCSLTDVRYCVSTSDNTVPKNRGNCGIAVIVP